MGCDTSKESVQPGEDELKEDVKNGDIPKATEATVSREEVQKSPVPSKKEGEEGEEEDAKQRAIAAAAIQAAYRRYTVRKKSMKDSDPQPVQIETTNQQNGNAGDMAAKQPVNDVVDTTTNNGDADKNALDDIDLTDEKLHNAAVTIQGGFRRHMKRKEEIDGKSLPVNNGNTK